MFGVSKGQPVAIPYNISAQWQIGAIAPFVKVSPEGLTRIIHELVYYEAKMVAILGRPRHSVLTVSGDTATRLIPAGAQAWQPFWLLTTTNP